MGGPLLYWRLVAGIGPHPVTRLMQSRKTHELALTIRYLLCLKIKYKKVDTAVVCMHSSLCAREYVHILDLEPSAQTRNFPKI